MLTVAIVVAWASGGLFMYALHERDRGDAWATDVALAVAGTVIAGTAGWVYG